MWCGESAGGQDLKATYLSLFCSFEWEELVGGASTQPICTEYILLTGGWKLYTTRWVGGSKLLLPVTHKIAKLGAWAQPPQRNNGACAARTVEAPRSCWLASFHTDSHAVLNRMPVTTLLTYIPARTVLDC